MAPKTGYTIRTFPSSRQSTFDVGYISIRKNHMKALIELDVTEARKLLRAYRRRQNAPVSLFAWILKCIGQAIEENNAVHALRTGRNKLVVFDEIDISIAVEKEVQGYKVPLPVVIRNVGAKTIQDIHFEIQAAKEQTVNSETDYILGDNRYRYAMRLYVLLPPFIRLAIWRIILGNPFLIKKMSGTVVVTSVGMMGQVKGWAIPGSFLPVSFILGSIVKKPGVVENRVEIREHLYMSIAIDHDVVDGAPATRFVSRLTELIEGGYGLSHECP